MASVDIYRAVRSLVLESGRYLHSACTNTENFNQGRTLPLCDNKPCQNATCKYLPANHASPGFRPFIKHWI